MTPVNPLIPAVMVAAFALFAGHTIPSASNYHQQKLAAVPFTKGNIVVVRVGDGVNPILTGGTAAACFVDEYSPAGTLVQSVPLPTATAGTNKALTISGTATSEGYISRSPDGTLLAMAGYNAAPGATGLTGATGAVISRTVAIINTDGAINTGTSLTDAAVTNNVRGAVTDGSNVWVTGGAGGLRFAEVGSSTSTQLSTTVANLRAINIFGNRLYVSTSSGSAVRVGTVGTTGVPTTSPQTITNLPGFSLTSSPHQFFMADVDPVVPGLDVLYATDDNAAGGILKYSLVGSNWVLNSTTGNLNDEYRGLAGRTSGGNVTLYAVRKGGGGAAGGGELVSLADNSGHNAAVVATPVLLATALPNQSFRGVALAPELAALPLNLLSFSSAHKGTQIAHEWRTERESNVDRFELERSADGKNYLLIASVPAKNSASSMYAFTESEPLTTSAFYRLKMVDKDGKFSFSSINKVVANAFAELSIYPNPVQQKATVKFSRLTQKGSLTISSINGSVLRSISLAAGEQQFTIDLTGLNKGMYILQVEGNGTKKLTRFEKQ